VLLQDLVKRLLVRDVQNRLGNLRGGCNEILSHPWFSPIDQETYTNKKVKAPWTPSIRGILDTSNFDQFAGDDHIDDGYVDRGNWDKDF
jgi:protein kinase A